MKKINYQDQIKESVEELSARMVKLDSAKLRERAEVLLWLKSGRVKTMKRAMELKGRSTNHGNNLWKQYQIEGIDSYLQFKHKGQVSPLRDRSELKEYLQKEGFSTIKEAQAWIRDKYGIEYTENGLGNYFRLHKIKLKTGRPHHPKKDEEKRQAYKKNMNRN